MDKLKSLPATPGVYLFYQKKEIIYIGKAINIQNRVKNHHSLIKMATRIGFIETPSEIEALILEAALIKKHQPKYNVTWKDDKNYFYVAIAGKIPYVYITHQKNSTQTLPVEFIGPFVEGTALKKTLKFLRRAFPYYTTKKHPKNKCTWCHLGLCPGSNPDLIEYRNNIKKLILILQGKKKAVLSGLKKEMQVLSKQNKFEEAAMARDKFYALQQIMSHNNVINNKKRIEAYDISNIQGKFATGSMVVFINGKPDKSLYRKFKIKMKNEPNDVAMLKEIITRRMTHKEWPYPNMMLIDGGKAQLNVAIMAKGQNKNIKVMAIAKKNNELFIEGKENPVLLKNLPQDFSNLILQLDAEAHRFAIAYHKTLRKKYILQ